MTPQQHPLQREGQRCTSLGTASAATAPGASLHRGAFPAQTPQVIGMNKARRQPVAAHGWQWASQTEAANALGVSFVTVHYRLKRGTFDGLVMQRLGVNPC